jgi:glycosyltransferase involved in cell wall biosynthesis
VPDNVTMRVLHLSQPTTEGVARVVADLVRDQLERGFHVTVACPPDGGLAETVRSLGAQWSSWPATRSPGPSALGESLRVRRLVRAADPDVVHLHSAKAGLAGRLALRGSRPTVFAPHAWSFEAVRGPVRTATRTWERVAVRWTDLLVCVSRAEQDVGERAGVRVTPTVVVPNGIDVERWSPASADERARARAELDEPAGPLAVCVGRLARQKGQDLLLDAWPAVRAAVPGARLALVGEGPELAALQERSVDGVRFVGGSSRVADWLAAADVVVLPSRWEGMALVPLEAMARGRSVVAFDVTGIAESLPPGAGEAVAADDVPGLAAAVAARLRPGADPDAEGRVGRAHVEARHDVRATAAQVAHAYERLLAARS